MAQLPRIAPKWVLASLIILVMAGLVYTGRVPTELGVAVIVGVAAGLGVYEGGKVKGRLEERSD